MQILRMLRLLLEKKIALPNIARNLQILICNMENQKIQNFKSDDKTIMHSA